MARASLSATSHRRALNAHDQTEFKVDDRIEAVRTSFKPCAPGKENAKPAAKENSVVGAGNGFPPPNLMGRFEAGGDCIPPVIASPATSGVMSNTPQGTPLGTLQVIFGAFVGCRNPIPDNPQTHKSIPPCAAPAHTPTPHRA